MFSRNKQKLSAGNVLVIGAGIAGLKAAKDLIHSGFDVRVLEARQRLGGRIFTDDSLGVPVDMGAAWIHGKINNPIFALSRRHGILTMPTDYAASCLMDEDGNTPNMVQRIAFAQRANRIMPRLKRLAFELVEDISVQDAVEIAVADANFRGDELRFLNRQLIELEAFNGTSLAEQSLFALVDDSLRFHGADMTFPRGYSQIASALAKGVAINYEETVLTIRQEANKVFVETTKGTHEADAAVVTLPLGVLKSGRVKFSPALPESKQSAITSIRMGLFNKIALRFSTVFWASDADMIELIPQKRSHVLQFLNWFRYSFQPILIACVAADTARAWEQDSDEMVKVKIMDILQRMYKHKTQEPINMKVSRWGTDEFSLGAYSAAHPGQSSNDYDALAEPFGRLFFAGEACAIAHHGSVPGAYLSGSRAAQELSKLSKQ